MSLFILCAYLVSSFVSAADTPFHWIKPVDPNLNPSAATVVVIIKEPLGLNPKFPTALATWQPDGMIVLLAPEATRSNILAALMATRSYGHVIVDFEMPGVGGDFGDPYLVPFGADPDDAKAGLRPSELWHALQGNQAWVAVISNTTSNGSTLQNQAMIGPDAGQWLAAALPGSNVFVLAAASGDKVPIEGCDHGWHDKLSMGLDETYGTGHDLTFYDLTTTSLKTSELFMDDTNESCNFNPEVKYSGSVTPKTVMLQGSGVLPDPVLEIKSKFIPVVDPVVPLTSVMMSSTSNEAPMKPKSRWPSVLGFAAGGGCLAGGVVESVLFQQGVKKAKTTFSDSNVRQNFVNAEAATEAWQAEQTKLSTQGDLAIAGYACAGLGLTLGTVTWVLSSNSVGASVPF